MKVAPEFVDLSSLDHHIDDIDCIPSLSLLAQIVSAQNLGISHVALALKVVNNPFVEVEAPVRESMCQLGFILAMSVKR